MALFRIREEQFKKWGAIRQMGKSRWILSQGLGLSGGFMFMLMTLVQMFVNHQAFVSRDRLLIMAVAWTVVGLLSALIMWHSAEKGYRNHLSQQTASPSPSDSHGSVIYSATD